MIPTNSSSSSNINQEKDELMAIIFSMRRKEENYLPDDYLQLMKDVPVKYDCSSDFKSIDKDWRRLMVEWCFTVSDHFYLDHDTVAIAMNNFDRFMSILCDEDIDDKEKLKKNTSIENLKGVVFYQLAAMVCFYTAVKIHEPIVIEPKIISMMSQGVYTEEQVIDMEQCVLHTIQWYLNPPTPISFVHCFLSLIPDEIIDSESKDYALIMELTKQQIELSIKDYSFVGSYASCVALAALTNSIQAINADKIIYENDTSLKFKLQKAISNIITDNNMCSEDFVLHQDRCWNLVQDLPPSLVNPSISLSIKTANSSGSDSSIYGSPRGVFF